MSHEIEGKIKELEEENLELKLSSIRKDLATLKVDMHNHLEELDKKQVEKLELILAQTSKTNGSVGRALERIANIEREDNKFNIEKLKEDLLEYKKQTRFWAILSTNKIVLATVLFTLYVIPMALQNDLLRSAIFKLF